MFLSELVFWPVISGRGVGQGGERDVQNAGGGALH
jgi:hypothetical protein